MPALLAPGKMLVESEAVPPPRPAVPPTPVAPRPVVPVVVRLKVAVAVLLEMVWPKRSWVGKAFSYWEASEAELDAPVPVGKPTAKGLP